MAFIISDRVIGEKLARNLRNAQKENAESLERLASGKIFTTSDPRPSERALTEGLEYRLRGLAAAKRNINDAVSLLQTADSGMSEITNMVIRMKEINTAASNTTLTDQERRYLFVEYEALYDEINRAATTTEFNGLPLLNGLAENAPDSLIFHVGDFFEGDDGEDLNVLRFEGFSQVSATTDGLGLKSARELLLNSDSDGGISVSEAEELMTADDDEYATAYDGALDRLATQRSVFGAMQSRLDRTMSFHDVYAENIAAAKSRIADTDYATEVAAMAQNNIAIQATTALLAQNNIQAGLALNLIGSVLK